MAASNGRKTASSNKKTTRTAKSTGRTSTQRKKTKAQMAQDSALFHEIGLIVLFAAMVFLFCCNFGIIGPIGDTVSGILFGVFGLTAYAVPVLLFLAVAFYFANEGNANAARKLAAGVALFVVLGIVCDLFGKQAGSMEKYDVKLLYESCREQKAGGGVLGGSLSFLLQSYLETIGTVLVVLLCSVVSLILLTEKSLLSGMKKGGSRVRELSREDAARRREMAEIRRQEQEENAQKRKEQARLRRQEQEENRARKAEVRRLRAEEKENEKILRMERKVSGVMLDTALPKPEENLSRRDDIHEIILEEETGEETPLQETYTAEPVEPEEKESAFDFEKIPIRGIHQVTVNEEPEEEYITEDGRQAEDAREAYTVQEERHLDSGGTPEEEEEFPRPSETFAEPEAGRRESDERESVQEPEDSAEPESQESGFSEPSDQRHPVGEQSPSTKPSSSLPAAAGSGAGGEGPAVAAQRNAPGPGKQAPKQYMLPPLSLLQKGMEATGDSARELRETAMRLQQTLGTFGVKVTITDISQGPSVTRYELQPEQGVKVSKIVGLSDDIKMHLAATDIRIEAPIPGKAAIGIEVPNKETMSVALRDLLENKEFQEFPSKIAFAVGKDIGGKTIVSDIAKMPHMLIAGATGSGKSVCINTLIISILYKARPDQVKLIMVDPKVVELSIYNGIPHLLIPVVTDPKKASAALRWGVAEMEDRYRKFAEYNVRDLKGYNKKVEAIGQKGDETAPAVLPQIVIIVDELADLMMVCPGEVEESICRLAQLARACGIHLIIATQRPSVDVITGLIKANMPSRVAFSVSSGVDSRTILDMVGAEKLLGKGDMLFYPQGYAKPARVQGAFVSDQEVSDVVDFWKNQVLGNTYAEDIEERIANMGSSGGDGRASGGSDVDELFQKAGHLIIDKDKASIGMLQRALQIGFNRAARIMDQLCQYGVVGEEEGTKPRKILMSPEQFEQLLEEIV
ncbi:MAG: DNA translocase FtsK [Lachnospiraceae bacterium]|nr:DNA translocase FtsK [Lachnospiraceae bacterium]